MISLFSIRVATFAALVASLADVLMLHVAGAMRPELGLTAPPPGTLLAGALLGAFALPFYVLGYDAVARAMSGGAPWLAVVVRAAGVVGAIVAPLIHVRTGTLIDASRRQAVAMADPLQATFGDPVLIMLWSIAGIAVTAGSIAFAAAAARGRTPLPRSVAGLNPASITIALTVAGLAGTFGSWGQAFIVPAAPNLAHWIWFRVLGWIALRAAPARR